MATDLGHETLDAVSFYERHGHVLRGELQTLSADCDREHEMRKRIEQLILSETMRVLPITGHDVMEAFAIEPGLNVRHLLECARRLYDERACGRDELLARVRERCRPDGSTGERRRPG